MADKSWPKPQLRLTLRVPKNGGKHIVINDGLDVTDGEGNVIADLQHVLLEGEVIRKAGHPGLCKLTVYADILMEQKESR